MTHGHYYEVSTGKKEKENQTKVTKKLLLSKINRREKMEKLTGLEDVDDQAHCMDQSQVHAPRALTLQLLPAQGPILHLEGCHSHTYATTNGKP